MPTARINGVELHYEVAGEGPTVVWLHGLLGSIERARLFGEGMGGLAKRGYRVIEYDARGHGDSAYTEDQSDYTWAAHARDMAGLMDQLGIERAIVGGGSMGAGASTVLALAHPDRVERLVLVAPPPLVDTIGTAQQVFGGLASLIEGVGLERAVEVVLQLPMYTEMKERSPAEYERMRAWLSGIREDAAVVAIRGLLFGPALPEERFGEITTPTLIVTHPDDPIHPVSTAETLYNAIAGSRLVMAPSMMHYREHPGELVETVEAFLTGDAVAK